MAASSDFLLDQRDQRLQLRINFQSAVFCQNDQIRRFDHFRRDIQRQGAAGTAELMGDSGRDEADQTGRQQVFLIQKADIEGLRQHNDDMSVTVLMRLTSFPGVKGKAGNR